MLSSILTNPILVILVLLLLVRMALGQLSERPRKVAMLWVLPALMIYISYAALVQDIFNAFYAAPLIFLPAIAVGCLMGLARGSIVKMRPGEVYGTVMMKGSIFSLIIWGAMLVLRYAAKYTMLGVGDTSMASIVLCALIVLSLCSTLFYYVLIYCRYFGLMNKDSQVRSGDGMNSPPMSLNNTSMIGLSSRRARRIARRRNR